MAAAPGPASIDHLLRVVPRQFGTAQNDAYVTAKENGYGHDLQAGYRIWITESVKALRKAKLIDGPDEDLTWVAGENGTWKVRLNRLITIYGKAERARGRDLHMLGEPDEKGGVVRRGLLLAGESQPLRLHVRRGIKDVIEKGENELDVHPLALAIPPMTAAEQEAIRKDIERNGVKVPLVLFQDKDDKTARGRTKYKILDGRHRGYFASQSGQPVDVEVFQGTEEEAKAHVASLNLYRRQLTKAQLAVVAVRLFAEEAKVEAERALEAGRIKGNKSRSSSGVKSSPTGEPENGRAKWHEIAAEKAGGAAAGITPYMVKHAEPITNAPETMAKVMAGEKGYTMIGSAKHKAEQEIARTNGAAMAEPSEKVRSHSQPIYKELGKAETALRNVLEDTTLEVGVEPRDYAGRLQRITGLVAEVEVHLKRLGLLS